MPVGVNTVSNETGTMFAVLTITAVLAAALRAARLDPVDVLRTRVATRAAHRTSSMPVGGDHGPERDRHHVRRAYRSYTAEVRKQNAVSAALTIAAVLAAMRAARLDPVEVLRAE